MKKVIKSDVLKDITKLVGSDGPRTGSKPLTNGLREIVKKNKVA